MIEGERNLKSDDESRDEIHDETWEAAPGDELVLWAEEEDGEAKGDEEEDDEETGEEEEGEGGGETTRGKIKSRGEKEEEHSP